MRCDSLWSFRCGKLPYPRLLSLVLKSVDFGAKSPCPASRTLPMGKYPRRHLSGALRGKNRCFHTLIDTFFG